MTMDFGATLRLGAALLALLPATAAAQRAIPGGTIREGTLSFDGHATAGDFTGMTTTVTGELIGADSLPAVRGWVEAPVKTLATGNGKRDRDLNRSMESDTYPTIRFELTGVAAPAVVGDSTTVELRGSFIIHGVTRAATLPASVVLLTDGVRVTAETPLNLKDFGVGGLSKMLGMLRMHEEIVVHVSLVFGTAPDPRAQAAATAGRS
jgi:polyisoprenoid-binding protein YceI